MYTWYKRHDDTMLNIMVDALGHFHSFEDVILLRPSSKKMRTKANAVRNERLKKRNVDNERNAETRKPSKKQREMNAWPDYIGHEIDVLKELDTDFNFPKIHFVSHWGEQIHLYWTFQKNSPEIHEHAHKQS